MKTPVRTIDPDANVVLGRVVSRVSRIFGVAAIVLGGSHARGTADPHSDIDLGIYYHAKNPFRIARWIRLRAISTIAHCRAGDAIRRLGAGR